MRLKNIKVVTVVHDDFEDLEYGYPYYRLQEKGAEVTAAGEKAGAKYRENTAYPRRRTSRMPTPTLRPTAHFSCPEAGRRTRFGVFLRSSRWYGA